MTTLTASTYIDAPPEKVWAILADFGGTWRYNPSVAKSHALTDANGGVGAERHCDLTFSGASVQERIVGWDDGRSYDVQILGGTKMPPIKDVLAHLEVASEGEGSRATGTMTYAPSGVVGRVMDPLMVRRQFGRAWSGIFAGLKYHAETGREVDTSTELDYEAVAA